MRDQQSYATIIATPTATSPDRQASAAHAHTKSRGKGAAGCGGRSLPQPRTQRRVSGSGLNSGSQCSTPASVFSTAPFDGLPSVYATCNSMPSSSLGPAACRCGRRGRGQIQRNGAPRPRTAGGWLPSSCRRAMATRTASAAPGGPPRQVAFHASNRGPVRPTRTGLGKHHRAKAGPPCFDQWRPIGTPA